MGGQPQRGRDHQQILALLAPVVAEEGLDLEDVQITPAGRGRVLRVVVDTDGGVSLDAVTQVSGRVSDVLDSSDVLGGASYVLEVTSPGVDRPLSTPRHWRRATGHLVEAGLADGGHASGRVVEATETQVVLDVDGEHRSFAYPDLGEGRVQVEFRRPDSRPERGAS